MFGFAKKIHKLEGETAAKCLADMMEDRGLSPQEFVMQADTLVLEALERVGIWEKLSNDAYKEICQLAVLMGNEQYTKANVDKVLKHFKG